MTRPTRAAPTPASYSWLFRAMGRLHRAFATLDLAVPRPLVATYAPPGSLRRWLPITEAAAQDDVEARDIVRYTYELVRRLRQQWVPARLLPRHLVHGDVRLGNICRSPASDTIYLDFGFLAVRPRIHELAYSLAFMVLALNGERDPATFEWSSVAQRVGDYESTTVAPLTVLEREALPVYTAAVPVYFAATAGLTADPAGQLRERPAFLNMSDWLLAHPQPIIGASAVGSFGGAMRQAVLVLYLVRGLGFSPILLGLAASHVASALGTSLAGLGCVTMVCERIERWSSLSVGSPSRSYCPRSLDPE
jgi:Ser/Thr protein kinase RdoA (MazF antagonist)